MTLLHSAMLRLVLKVKHRTSSSFYIASCPPAQESSRAAGASSKEAPAQSMHQKAGAMSLWLSGCWEADRGGVTRARLIIDSATIRSLGLLIVIILQCTPPKTLV